MNLFSLFRRQPPIRARQDLGLFIDEHAAFVVQKGIYEYSRARAGHYAKVLFGEPTFIEALELSRWSAFPIGLVMVAEVADGVLRPHAATAHGQPLRALRRIVLAVYDGYPVSPAVGKPAWDRARTGLDQRLSGFGQHPPKRSFEVPDAYAREYFDLMPIHEKLRARDFPTMHNYLRLTLCNIHDELTRRIDAPALIASLRQMQV